MTSLHNIPVIRRGAQIIQIDGPNGNNVYIRMMRGVKLVRRSDLIEYFASKHHIDRLVSQGLLTPYFPNGEIKQRLKNGRLPGGETYYDWEEWEADKYNKLYSS